MELNRLIVRKVSKDNKKAILHLLNRLLNDLQLKEENIARYSYNENDNTYNLEFFIDNDLISVFWFKKDLLIESDKSENAVKIYNVIKIMDFNQKNEKNLINDDYFNRFLDKTIKNEK